MTAFGPLFVPRPLLDAVSDRAWFEAMLEFEAELLARLPDQLAGA